MCVSFFFPRDLADTWNIDIAQELENYLDELSTLKISLDGGKSSCNFAEAALLIQGATSLYAKKVNALEQLVYAALSAVTNKTYDQAVRLRSRPRVCVCVCACVCVYCVCVCVVRGLYCLLDRILFNTRTQNRQTARMTMPHCSKTKNPSF